MKISRTKRGYLVDFYHPITQARFRKVIRAQTANEAKQIFEVMRTNLLKTGKLLPESEGDLVPLKDAIVQYKSVCSAAKSDDSKRIDRLALIISRSSLQYLM